MLLAFMKLPESQDGSTDPTVHMSEGYCVCVFNPHPFTFGPRPERLGQTWRDAWSKLSRRFSVKTRGKMLRLIGGCITPPASNKLGEMIARESLG